MQFFDRLENLKEQYKDDCIVQPHGAVRMHPGVFPNARHTLFKPLTDEIIEEYLVKEYVPPFPEDIKELLKYTNGAHLFGVELKYPNRKPKWSRQKGYSLSGIRLSLLGLPGVPPMMRGLDRLEPADIRVEDIEHWGFNEKCLKFGFYEPHELGKDRYDLYHSVENSHIWMCNKDVVVREWDTMDDCLCGLFDESLDKPLIYIRE